jgi:hypothetical protein
MEVKCPNPNQILDKIQNDLKEFVGCKEVVLLDTIQDCATGNFVIESDR